eukprot:13834580-Ditylum_brightwellii.AAC.1
MEMKQVMALLMKKLMTALLTAAILVIIPKVQAEVTLGEETMAEAEPVVKVAILMRTMIHPVLHCFYS